jgi:hypothetical protein
MYLIAPLFIALSEFLVRLRPAKEVAQALAAEHGVKLPDLSVALPGIHHHSWHGKLAAALADPDFPPDLVTKLIHLARLERCHSDLLEQHTRAEDLRHRISAQPEVINLEQFKKAEAFTFKVKEAIARILRDLQKAQNQYEKALNAKSKDSESAKTIAGKPRMAQNPVQTPASASNLKESLTKEAVSETDLDAQSVACLPPSPAPTAPPVPAQPIADPGSDQEFQACLIRNRHLIKNTPAKDRPALIAKLREREKAKQTASSVA